MSRGLHSMLIALLGVVLFTSCEKEEPLYELVIPPTKSEVAQMEMGTNYATQVYFDFSTGASASNEFKIWDIAFPTDFVVNNIRLNDGNTAKLTPSSSNVMSDKEFVPITGWLSDKVCGCKDSCAIGDWYEEIDGIKQSKGLIYIVDRGEVFSTNRYYKFRVVEFDEKQYTFEYANLDGSNKRKRTLDIDPHKNYVYFNFENDTREDVELMDRDKWDVIFRPYRFVFYDEDPVLEYLVVGALSNPMNVKVWSGNTIEYDSINRDFALQQEFSEKRDKIGYDWKEFDRNTNRYTVDHKRVYLIKDTEGIIYKLRFLSFYNDFGDKGYPKFEYQKL